ncbi:LD-carboxypeptidase [Roseateles oligotrophus]|uniref:LD-carboxypeptidase n=1 Tax=Roseateles oligotrophus TaxID=1769250 RepID=A0ABT2YGY6_9BURK|nr:LD-carboxypeptidase [Roseateles oligotrophus]MCV2369326.1 LD-carboxypeptidase [Roseateles oligotrophus]
MSNSLTLYTPAGVLAKAQPIKRAAKRLAKLGFEVSIDEAAFDKHQRFGGDDDTRLAAIHRVAAAAPSVALATRGGYGLTRLLDRIDWKLLAKSVEQGTRWVGQSDLTALQLGLLTHAKAPHVVSWSGPLGVDFGRSDKDGGVDDVTQDCFTEAMSGQLEAVGFRTEKGFDGLCLRGQLWGGNLCMVNSMLGTAHFPRIKGGVLFLEDINEHPYRVERSLLQLAQAGVLDAQKAIVLGDFGGWRASPLDRGYDLKSAIAAVRAVTKTPILTGLPFGHVDTKVCLPVGAKVDLVVQGRNVLLGWQNDPLLKHEHEHGDAGEHSHAQ